MVCLSLGRTAGVVPRKDKGCYFSEMEHKGDLGSYNCQLRVSFATSFLKLIGKNWSNMSIFLSGSGMTGKCPYCEDGVVKMSKKEVKELLSEGSVVVTLRSRNSTEYKKYAILPHQEYDIEVLFNEEVE